MRNKISRLTIIFWKRISPYALVISFLALWQIFAGCLYPRINPMAVNIFPSPVKVFYMGLELFNKGELVPSVRDSVCRVLAGFSLAAVIGIFLGIIMGLNNAVKVRVKALIVLLRPIPPFAWIPLGLIWFGVGTAEILMVIVISGVFPMALHTLYGIENIDFRLKQAAASLGADRWLMLKKVIIPGVLPELFSGLRLSLGFCWVVLVGAEMVGSVSGLGYLILDSRNRGLPQMAVLGMVIIGMIGAGMDCVLALAGKRFLPWFKYDKR